MTFIGPQQEFIQEGKIVLELKRFTEDAACLALWHLLRKPGHAIALHDFSEVMSSSVQASSLSV